MSEVSGHTYSRFEEILHFVTVNLKVIVSANDHQWPFHVSHFSLSMQLESKLTRSREMFKRSELTVPLNKAQYSVVTSSKVRSCTTKTRQST